MSMHAGWGMMRSMTRDSSVAQRKLAGELTELIHPGELKKIEDSLHAL